MFIPAEPVCSMPVEVDDPLGLVETATTTVTTTPLSPRRSRAVETSKKSTISFVESDHGEFNSSELFVPPVAEEWIIQTDDVVCWTEKNNGKGTVKKKSKQAKRKTKRATSSHTPFNIKSQKHSRKKKKQKPNVGSRTNERENQIRQEYSADRDEGQNNSRRSLPSGPELGQVVHLVRDEWEETDVDVDISDDDQLMIVDKVSASDTSAQEKEETRNYVNETAESTVETWSVYSNYELESKKQQIFSFPIPTEEKELDPDWVSEEEKRVHFEYFDGRGVKTPERYLKIRNYLLNFWKQIKPKYMRKTVGRAGLKNCGDVNSIGKIHEYLEKIGAINFGCPESNYSSTLVIGEKKKKRR